MTKPQEPFPKVPPFILPEPPHRKGVDMRGMISIITMLVSLAALTLAMLGAARFVLDVFDEGLKDSLDGLPLKLIVLGLAFLFGWGIGLVSIRGFGNLVYPIIIQIYSWACLIAVSGLYLNIISKLYLQKYDSVRFWAYLLMLLGGLFVLICLHLMVEGHDLRPFAIPLLAISVIQLFTIIVRYIFVDNPNGLMLFGDLAIFAVMISISALMLAHLGILSPLRDWVDELFLINENSNHDHNNHNGDEEE
jgi:hypothetical protein